MKVQAVDYTDGVEYLCEECDGREVAREVKVVPQPPSAPPGHTYYLTLLKDDLLVRQGNLQIIPYKLISGIYCV